MVVLGCKHDNWMIQLKQVATSAGSNPQFHPSLRPWNSDIPGDSAPITIVQLPSVARDGGPSRGTHAPCAAEGLGSSEGDAGEFSWARIKMSTGMIELLMSMGNPPWP